MVKKTLSYMVCKIRAWISRLTLTESENISIFSQQTFQAQSQIVFNAL